MLLEELAHVGLAEGHWDTVDASLKARSKIILLQCILGTKLSGSLGD